MKVQFLLKLLRNSIKGKLCFKVKGMEFHLGPASSGRELYVKFLVVFIG